MKLDFRASYQRYRRSYRVLSIITVLIFLYFFIDLIRNFDLFWTIYKTYGVSMLWLPFYDSAHPGVVGTLGTAHPLFNPIQKWLSVLANIVVILTGTVTGLGALFSWLKARRMKLSESQ
jgi:hypothetical protein